MWQGLQSLINLQVIAEIIDLQVYKDQFLTHKGIQILQEIDHMVKMEIHLLQEEMGMAETEVLQTHHQMVVGVEVLLLHRLQAAIQQLHHLVATHL